MELILYTMNWWRGILSSISAFITADEYGCFNGYSFGKSFSLHIGVLTSLKCAVLSIKENIITSILVVGGGVVGFDRVLDSAILVYKENILTSTWWYGWNRIKSILSNDYWENFFQ